MNTQYLDIECVIEKVNNSQMMSAYRYKSEGAQTSRVWIELELRDGERPI